MPDDKHEDKTADDKDRSLEIRVGQPFKTPPGLEELAKASKAAGEAVRMANPGLEKLAKASEAMCMANSAVLRDALRPFNEASKTLVDIQGKSGLANALKSVDAARDIMGPRSFMEDMLPPGPSPAAMKWQAEKAAAPVQTRDAVYALADAVESLAQSERRADNILIWLTVAILALTALIALRDFHFL